MTTRRIPALTVLAAAVLTVAGCSSSPATTNANSQTIVVTTGATHSSAAAAAASSVGPTCDLTKEPDVIVWYKVPTLQDSAQVLGGWDPETCKSSIAKIMASVPTGTGYCTAIAYASDNPGYNADATPAKPLKHIIEEIGGSC